MVTDTLPIETPAWMDAQTTARGAVNINDIYWKRSEKEESPGWILVGPSAERDAMGRTLTAQAESWMRKGRVPLIEYSYTSRLYKNGERHTIETNADRLNTEWRWWWLFKNGGAHLFPIEQIVAYHWHVKPPYGLPLSVFPQLAEWDVPAPRYCAACPGTRAPRNSDEELVTHAMIAHRMTEPQARDLLKYAASPPVGSGGLEIRRKAVVIEEAAKAAGIVPIEMPSPDLPQATRFICNYCGSELKNLAGQLSHERNCTDKPVPAGEAGGQTETAPGSPGEE